MANASLNVSPSSLTLDALKTAVAACDRKVCETVYGVSRLIGQFMAANPKATQRSVAKGVGKDETYVSRAIKVSVAYTTCPTDPADQTKLVSMFYGNSKGGSKQKAEGDLASTLAMLAGIVKTASRRGADDQTIADLVTDTLDKLHAAESAPAEVASMTAAAAEYVF